MVLARSTRAIPSHPVTPSVMNIVVAEVRSSAAPIAITRRRNGNANITSTRRMEQAVDVYPGPGSRGRKRPANEPETPAANIRRRRRVSWRARATMQTNAPRIAGQGNCDAGALVPSGGDPDQGPEGGGDRRRRNGNEERESAGVALPAPHEHVAEHPVGAEGEPRAWPYRHLPRDAVDEIAFERPAAARRSGPGGRDEDEERGDHRGPNQGSTVSGRRARARGSSADSGPLADREKGRDGVRRTPEAPLRPVTGRSRTPSKTCAPELAEQGSPVLQG